MLECVDFSSFSTCLESVCSVAFSVLVYTKSALLKLVLDGIDSVALYVLSGSHVDC